MGSELHAVWAALCSGVGSGFLGDRVMCRGTVAVLTGVVCVGLVVTAAGQSVGIGGLEDLARLKAGRTMRSSSSDGKPVGKAADLYNTSVKTEEHLLAAVPLEAGEHVLGFRNVGAHRESKGYFFGLDGFLTALRKR